MTDEHELICPTCESVIEDDEQRADEMCVNCYENAECPDYCNGEHDAPSPDYDGSWECETSGIRYVLDAGEWNANRYGESTYIDYADEWYCYPSEHGYAYCGTCEEWRYEDDVRSTRRGTRCDYCSDYDDERGSDPDTMAIRCEHDACRNRTITQWHPITERVACADHNLPGYEPVPVLVNA